MIKNRSLLMMVLVVLAVPVVAQQKIENLVLITTDGLRWQELYQGMDTVLANDKAFNQGDSSGIYGAFWSADAGERRKKLMPFMWSAIAARGQLYGNRLLGNKVDNANPHWFSYPGYSEIITGYPDEKINSNSYPANPHVSVLEYLNRQSAFKNRIAVFGAWEAFDRIVNEERSGITVISAFDTVPGKKLNGNQKLINTMLLNSHRPWGDHECLDQFTHYAAMEYLKVNKPRVMHIAYGETDEWAHAGKYKYYLQSARQVDIWLKEIWEFIQSDPQYRDKTALVITTDHGRGDQVKKDWTSHGKEIAGASEIWLAVMAPGLKARGEVGADMQLYQKQIAQTIARLLGTKYTASHTIAGEIKVIWE